MASKPSVGQARSNPALLGLPTARSNRGADPRPTLARCDRRRLLSELGANSSGAIAASEPAPPGSCARSVQGASSHSRRAAARPVGAGGPPRSPARRYSTGAGHRESAGPDRSGERRQRSPPAGWRRLGAPPPAAARRHFRPGQSRKLTPDRGPATEGTGRLRRSEVRSAIRGTRRWRPRRDRPRSQVCRSGRGAAPRRGQPSVWNRRPSRRHLTRAAADAVGRASPGKGWAAAKAPAAQPAGLPGLCLGLIR
jgi:hypothetical protein